MSSMARWLLLLVSELKVHVEVCKRRFVGLKRTDGNVEYSVGLVLLLRSNDDGDL